MTAPFARKLLKRVPNFGIKTPAPHALLGLRPSGWRDPDIESIVVVACPHVLQDTGWLDGFVHNSSGPCQCDATSIGGDAIEDHVHDLRLSVHLWPVIDGNLPGDQDRGHNARNRGRGGAGTWLETIAVLHVW